MKTRFLSLALGLTLGMTVSASALADTNKALDAWKAYAAKTGNPNHKKWVDAISKPEAIKMAKEWKELRGYDAYDLIEKARAAGKIPADLKPGLKITKANAAQYPWLKDFLPKEFFDQLTGKDDWGTIDEITIVPTNTYYMHNGYLANTKKLKDEGVELKINEKGELLYPDGSYALMHGPAATAVPFLHPKNGLELNWSYVAHTVDTDTLDFEPIHMRACTPSGKLDSEYKADLWWWHYHNRTMVEPLGDIDGKEDFIEGGSVFFKEPYDIRGLAGVRQRYPEAGHDDDFKVFIPSLRRTRVLTGSDAQDPIAAGQELTWDDWRAYWSKTDVDAFDYKLVGETFILASPETGMIYDSAKLAENQCGWKSMELELRPVWIFDVIDKTGKYMYSKRRTYVDQEFYYMQYHMTWDPRGNPFRNWDDSRYFNPSTGEAHWRYVTVNNYATKRFSTLFMTPKMDDSRGDRITEEMFDVDQLRDYQ